MDRLIKFSQKVFNVINKYKVLAFILLIMNILTTACPIYLYRTGYVFFATVMLISYLLLNVPAMILSFNILCGNLDE